MDNMTALVSCFARAWHFRNNTEWVFKDEAAGKILSEAEYQAISTNMSQGIQYFAPDFKGTDAEALRYIVDHNLSPSVLVRSAFCKRAFENEESLGCRQAVLFACGYDSFSAGCSDKIHVFELDQEAVIKDKEKRITSGNITIRCDLTYVPCDLSEKDWIDALRKSGFQSDRKSFGSLLGISYYLTKDAFRQLLLGIAKLWFKGSAICFDYPVSDGGEESDKNRELAAAAREEMQANYSYHEIETLLQECGFLNYEDYDDETATQEFCSTYNARNPDHGIIAPKGVRYCLAIRS